MQERLSAARAALEPHVVESPAGRPAQGPANLSFRQSSVPTMADFDAPSVRDEVISAIQADTEEVRATIAEAHASFVEASKQQEKRVTDAKHQMRDGLAHLAADIKDIRAELADVSASAACAQNAEAIAHSAMQAADQALAAASTFPQGLEALSEEVSRLRKHSATRLAEIENLAKLIDEVRAEQRPLCQKAASQAVKCVDEKFAELRVELATLVDRRAARLDQAVASLEERAAATATSPVCPSCPCGCSGDCSACVAAACVA